MSDEVVEANSIEIDVVEIDIITPHPDAAAPIPVSIVATNSDGTILPPPPQSVFNRPAAPAPARGARYGDRIIIFASYSNVVTSYPGVVAYSRTDLLDNPPANVTLTPSGMGGGSIVFSIKTHNIVPPLNKITVTVVVKIYGGGGSSLQSIDFTLEP